MSNLWPSARVTQPQTKTVVVAVARRVVDVVVIVRSQWFVWPEGSEWKQSPQ